MASRYGDALGWGDISPVKRTALEQAPPALELVPPISPIPSPRQLRALEDFVTQSPAEGGSLADRFDVVGSSAAPPRSSVVITTGSDELDTLLGGGIETGVVTEVRGSARAMLHLSCALSVTTQLPEAAPTATQCAPGRLYGMKLFGGANGKVMVIDTRGDFLDGRSSIYAVSHRFGLDPEAVLDNITYTCTADHGAVDDSLAGQDKPEEELEQSEEEEEEDDEEDEDEEEQEFSPAGFSIHYPGGWSYPVPQPEPEPAPGAVSPWPVRDVPGSAATGAPVGELSDALMGGGASPTHALSPENDSVRAEHAPWPASLGIEADRRRQEQLDAEEEAATRRGLETIMNSDDEEIPEPEPEPEQEQEPEPEPRDGGGDDDAGDKADDDREEAEVTVDEGPLDMSAGAWQTELLQEAAELIVSEAGTHPRYRCLIVMQPQNFFAEWTEKSRDEVLDKMSAHVMVRASEPASKRSALLVTERGLPAACCLRLHDAFLHAHATASVTDAV